MATRREREERAEYERLHQKYGDAPKSTRPRRQRPADDDDDSPVLMFSGRRADGLISRLFGDDDQDQSDDDDQGDDDQGDDDDPDDDDDQDLEDEKPARGHRFFEGRRKA